MWKEEQDREGHIHPETEDCEPYPLPTLCDRKERVHSLKFIFLFDIYLTLNKRPV